MTLTVLKKILHVFFCLYFPFVKFALVTVVLMEIEKTIKEKNRLFTEWQMVFLVDLP